MWPRRGLRHAGPGWSYMDYTMERPECRQVSEPRPWSLLPSTTVHVLVQERMYMYLYMYCGSNHVSHDSRAVDLQCRAYIMAWNHVYFDKVLSFITMQSILARRRTRTACRASKPSLLTFIQNLNVTINVAVNTNQFNKCVESNTYIHTHTHTHIHTHTYIHTYTYIHAWIHTYIYIHSIHTYIHTFVFESTIGVFIPNSAVQNTISGSCWGSFCVH